MARLQKKSRRQSPQVQPNIRHSPRDGFNAYIVISSVHRLLATVRDNALARIARDTSIGVPGPHDFTSAGQRSSHASPTSIASPPHVS